MDNRKISKDGSEGKLGVMIVGLCGAVSTTFLAGVFSINKNISLPIGSLTQMSMIEITDENGTRNVPIRDLVSLYKPESLVFGGWDIRNESAYDGALHAGVLKKEDLDKVKPELDSLRPIKAVFDRNYVKRIQGDWVKPGKNKYELMEEIRADIRKFRNDNNLTDMVIIWCASTEIFIPVNGVHSDTKVFFDAMKENHPDISPNMLYTTAAILEGVPFINGAPNLAVDAPAIIELSKEHKVPIAGKDFKTGQTLMKTVIAPMIKAKMLGLRGWFSVNILGNRDGEVLDDPDSFKTKEESKLSVLRTILRDDLYPELYSDYYHKVRINYYPPRGDDKEGWDNIDIFGWMGYPMQIKVDFLCKDSILAAPLVLDLILFMDYAKRNGMFGVQDWLSFYFKSPDHEVGEEPEHDLFKQLNNLHETLKSLAKSDVKQVVKQFTN